MTDNPNKTGKQDRAQINAHRRWELRYWTRKLGMSRDGLRELVKRVGTQVKKIRKALKGE